MKILITGSSGYVGYVLAKYFSEKGIEVIGLDIVENPVWNGNKKFKFFSCDVTDRKKLQRVFQKERPTHVIHLAYLMNPIHDKKRGYEIDVVGSINTIKAANGTKSVKQFIQLSSASAYGAWPHNKLWIKETQELRPRDYRYGINKKIVEDYYNSFKKREDMRLVILRMCTAIGPLYHKKGGVVSILELAPFILKLNGRYCELQFIHEDDLTSLMKLIVNDPDAEGTFNLAPDSYATTKELVPGKSFLWMPLRLVRSIIGLLWFLRIVNIRPAAITLSAYGIIIDPKKLMDRYNYIFKYSTSSGYRDTVRKRRKKGSL